jgi:hypothetical protein
VKVRLSNLVPDATLLKSLLQRGRKVPVHLSEVGYRLECKVRENEELEVIGFT